jgi:putative addiction module killer protein
VDRRLIRVLSGNFGDHTFCRDGVWELRLDLGPGYRIYYGVEGQKMVILLIGGDKKTQRADIDRASDFWKDWQERGE